MIRASGAVRTIPEGLPRPLRDLPGLFQGLLVSGDQPPRALLTAPGAFRGIPGLPKTLLDLPVVGRSLENQCFPMLSLRFPHIRRFAHPGLSGRSPRLSRGSSGTSRGSPKSSRHSLGALPGAPGGLRDALPEPPGAFLVAPEAFRAAPGLPNSLTEPPQGLLRFS